MTVFGYSSLDPDSTACINYWNDPLRAACASYLRSTQVLLRHVLEHRSDLDMLALPILFGWRHYLELRLKTICIDAAIVQEEKSTIDKTHDLAWLWEKARARLVMLFPNEDHDGELHVIDAHIPELAKIDPGSMTFRYTVGKKWEPLLPNNLTHIAYAELAQVVRAASLVLEGADYMMMAARDHVLECRAAT